MRRILLCAGLALAGCDAPSPGMRGATTTHITIAHSDFTVHRLGDQVEAVRTSFEAGPKARGVMARGRLAMVQATGCELVPGTFTGDPALMRARLACGPDL